ncbi:MAG: hypothetical protein AAFP03_08460, partial [Cyanobacteria bacterium J06598_3]
MGAAISVNNISSQTKAYLANSKATSTNSDVVVDAKLTSSINNVSVGGAGAGTFALGGSVAVNNIDTLTEANISKGADVTAENAVTVFAMDNADIRSLTGGGAGGGKAAIGAAVATNLITNEAKAIIDNATVTANSEGVTVKANLDATILNATVGGAGAGAFALGGSVSTNDINTLAEANIRNNAEVTAEKAVTVSAIDNSDISGLAGGGAGAGKAAIGAAVATNLILNEVNAQIDNATVTSKTDNVTVEANLTATITNATVGGAGAGVFALGGAVSTNNIGTRTDAKITNSANVTAEKSVTVSATDSSDINALAGGGAGAGKAAIGAAVATNLITNTVQSTIDNATVTANTEAIDVTANLSATILNATVAGAGAGAFALGGAVSTNDIDTLTEASIRNNAEVTAQTSVTVRATDKADIEGVAGGVAGAGKAAIGAAVATNLVLNDVKAHIDNATVTANDEDVTVEANLTATIKNATVGGAGAGGVAVSGSISTNNIDTLTEATIGNNAEVTAETSVNVRAVDDSEIQSFAGGFAGAGAVAVGAAAATNLVNNDIKARIDAAKITAKSEQVDVEATLTANIKNVTVGGAGAGNTAVGGSVSVNRIGTLTEAGIGANAQVMAQTNVNVSAKDDAKIQVGAGGFAGAGANAVGAAVATNFVDNQSKATLDDAIVTAKTGAVTVEADLTADIQNITVGGAGAGIYAFGGAVSVNNINTLTEANIANNAQVTAQQAVDVLADDASKIQAIAGGAAGAGTAAIGAAIATNNINNKTKAIVDNATVTSEANNVNVKSNLSATVQNITAGGAGAGTFALGGAVSVNNTGTLTEAAIKNNSTVNAKQDVQVLADNQSTIESLAGQVSGAGTVAIGASVAVNNIGGNTTASTVDSQVEADGAIKAMATGDGTIKTISAGGSVAGTVAVTGSVSVNNITSNLTAAADGATLSAESLDISAKSTAKVQSLAGQVSAGLVGVGAAAAYNNIGNSVTAHAKASTIETDKDALIKADNAGTIQTYSVGLSAGAVGVGGSVAVNEMTQTTSAYVQGGKVTAQGSVGILANASNKIDSNGGTVAAGAAGVGGTVLVNHLDNDTQAYVSDNATVNAQGNQILDIPADANRSTTEAIQGLGVVATSDDELDVLLGTASAGGAAFAGTVSVNTLTNKTQAYVRNSGINIDETNASANQSAHIKALNNTDVDVTGGTASVGGVAIGGTIDVTSINNLTAAYVDNDENQGRVSSRKDLVIEANAKKTVESVTVAAGAGAASVQGAVSVLNVSSAMSDQSNEAAADTQTVVANNLKGINDAAKDSDGNSFIQTRSDTTTTWNGTDETIKGTVAYLSGRASVNGDIQITADETTTVEATTGAASLGAIGVGGAVAIANVTHDVSAYVGDNSTLNVGRQNDIHINAVGLVDLEGESIAGAAGAVGLGAAVTVVSSENNASAYIGEGTDVTQARHINITSGSSSNIEADGLGAAIGAAAVGVVVASGEESGTTQAYVGNDVNITDTKRLNVQAIVNEQVSAESQAAAGGIISGNGSIPTATVNPDVKAYIGDRTNIKVSEDVVVQTNAEVDADAEAKGINIGAISVGVSKAEVNANPNIQTYVGADTTIDAQNVTVESRLGEPLTVVDNAFAPSTVVDNNSNSLSFTENHGFRTGDTVFYLNGGGNSIGGLDDKNAYSIIKVDDKTVKLGSQFDASEIDTGSNTLKFDGNHGFQNGDEIIYEAPVNGGIEGLVSGQTYYVVVIDGQTVKLSDQVVNGIYEPTIQGASASDFKTTNNSTAIEIDNHGFNNGDVVNYSQRSAKFTIVTTLPDTDGEETIFNLKNTIVDNNVINSADHGFKTNDRVIYRTTGQALGGLTSGQTYYVIRENDNNFKLSATQNGSAIDIASADESTFHEIEAVGLSVRDERQFGYGTDNATNSIALASHGFKDNQQVTYNTSGTALGGLTKGSQYYVIKVDNGTFQLSTTKGGNAIDISAGSGTHNLTFTEALDAESPYYVVEETPGTIGVTDSFKISKTKGGPALTLLTNNSGEGDNHLFSKEQDGIVDLTGVGQGTHNLHIDLNSAGATGSKHLLSKGATVTIPSQGDNVFSAHAQASSGALIGGNATLARLNISPTVKTYVGDRTQLTTTGDVNITSLSGVEATGSTDSNVFGAIAVGASKINANITNNNTTYVGSNAVINAKGDVVVDGQVSQSFNVSGSGGAGSLITFVDADAHASVTYTNNTYIGEGTTINAQEDVTVQ